MIDFYCWRSGNNRKIFIMLEETGLPYARHIVNLHKGEQKRREYRAINPNGKVPAILDKDGPGGKPFRVFESGAILIYLAEKSGQFHPTGERQWFDVMQWLMFQMAGPGALFTEATYFYERKDEPEMAYPLERYTKEAKRLLEVMEQRLGVSEYIAGESYSIADMALWPHCGTIGRFGATLEDYPNIHRWFDAVGTRPAVRRAGEIIDEVRREAAA
ncbi:MAG TPA: glutathione S-transferase N-terminal domain-containing protein [Alphaproteobacteria bacterium]|jgi:GST-like protein